MITLSVAPPALSSDLLSLYYARDPLLENLPVLVFYGPCTVGNVTHNSSRIQAHIYSLAGFQSFPRLTIAPSSPLYAAVNHLPSDQQGDEVSRGLAVALLSYFAGLSKEMKATLRIRVASQRTNRLAPMMFDEMHAGDLAAGMEHLEDCTVLADFVMSALPARGLSWADMDVVLPRGTIHRVSAADEQDTVPQYDEAGLPLNNYGEYTSIIESLGSPAFLPTTKLQRAPSRPLTHSKSKVLSKDEKISLRRELCELIDTENNYIGKIKELADTVAVGFRQKCDTDVVKMIFPDSLHEIVKINGDFYREIQSILDETENEAIRDIEGNNGSGNDLGSPVTQGRRRDPTGATHVAKALLRCFPKFMNPYQEYLRASTHFPNVIGNISGDPSSDVFAYLQSFGEQRLRSALIEPVQRLPRYSLLIDNVVSLLPASHSALSYLLKARDIVTDICALDTPITTDITRSTRTLKNLVEAWPLSLSPKGRLVTAVDVVELQPPYSSNAGGSNAIVLLFVDIVVILRPCGATPVSARGIIAEIDRPTPPINSFWPSESGSDKNLIFHEAYDPFDLSFLESEDSQSILMMVLGETAPILSSTSTATRVNSKVYSLLGPYHGKVARFSEEVVKARIESRYPESVRDSEKWALRSLNPSAESLGFLVVLSEDEADKAASIARALCPVQVTVDGSSNTKAMLSRGRHTIVAACITTIDAGTYRLVTEGADGTSFTDSCSTENLTDVLLARLGNLIRLQSQLQKSTSLQSLILFNETVLRQAPIENHQDSVHARSFRPLSPVKMISNLLAGNSLSQPSTPSKFRSHLSIMKDVPSLPPPVPSKSGIGTNDAITQNAFNDGSVPVESTKAYVNPLALLEDTSVAYIVALRSRSGNVVGKILRSRAMADELAVNELYNALLEDPSRLQAAAEVSIDVLFAAFEKFLKRAWRERMGPLLPTNVLQNLQATFDSGKPVIFAEQFKRSLEDMSPQNRRVFTSTVNLLAELLDASGNDGDRGALIASFAEALVIDGNPHTYIMLLDRLVDDYDSLFGEASNNLGAHGLGSTTGSLTRTRSFNTGSLSSNASSLRKKFGFSTLTRENSKNESESKVASIWRTLSKNARVHDDGQSQPQGSSKATTTPLGRSRSTDTDSRMLPPSRPISRDRPTTSGSDEPRSRPGSSHLNTSNLSSIGENTPTKSLVLPKKKRRSSLSDLKSLNEPDSLIAWSPLQPRKLPKIQDLNGGFQTPPKSSSPIKQSPTQWAHRQSPQASGLPRRIHSPQRKENSPLRENSPRKASSPSMSRTPNPKVPTKNRSEEVIITSFGTQKRQTSRTGIPTPRNGLSERQWPPNGNSLPPKKTPATSQRLRNQSPQKIQQRVSQEQKTLTISDESFQAEMTKIGEEMAAYKLQRSSTKPRSTVPSSRSDAQPRPSTPTLESLSAQLAALAKNLASFTEAQKASLNDITSDVDTSLQVSEKKARKLDELYREANAENEALYERFNDELSKILGKVRKGEGVEETRSKLKEAQDEVAKLKRENAKLKREAVGLRSMLRGD